MDALASLIDIVGLDVRHQHEVRSSRSDWTVQVGPTSSHVWIASRYLAELWVDRSGDLDVVRPGGAVLVAPTGRLVIGTGPGPGAPPVVDPGEDLFSSTGVHLGSAVFGALAREALPLGPFTRTVPHGCPSEDVVRALSHLGALTGVRWASQQRDALARVVVCSVLRQEPPAFLRNGSLADVIGALLAADARTPTTAVLRGARVSERTVRRRFAETIGCSPDEFRRWHRSLLVRAALGAGTPARAVAAEYGFADVASMRRALGRVVAPGEHALDGR